jgi:hypothetical protein
MCADRARRRPAYRGDLGHVEALERKHSDVAFRRRRAPCFELGGGDQVRERAARSCQRPLLRADPVELLAQHEGGKDDPGDEGQRNERLEDQVRRGHPLEVVVDHVSDVEDGGKSLHDQKSR